MEICPKNIWIEDQFLVYLRPFKVQTENYSALNHQKTKKPKKGITREPKLSNSSKYWYIAPEQILKEDLKSQFAEFDQDSDSSLSGDYNMGLSDFSSDMWSLGCVFAEMFVSLTPIFQSVDSYDRIFRYFEVLFLI